MKRVVIEKNLKVVKELKERFEEALKRAEAKKVKNEGYIIYLKTNINNANESIKNYNILLEN